jgi:alpha-tubulin suppressor-like RCC1 family protein
MNTSGQVGDGTLAARHLPVAVKNPAGTASLGGVTQIAPRDVHSCALLSGGSVVCWGANATGQLGDGTTTNRSRPVAVEFP